MIWKIFQDTPPIFRKDVKITHQRFHEPFGDQGGYLGQRCDEVISLTWRSSKWGIAITSGEMENITTMPIGN